MRDRCASSPEAPESILCLIAWTIRLMLRSPLLSMTCIWSFSCSVASGDALHERDFRMLPKHELLLAICDLLISLISPRTYLRFCIPSVLMRKPAVLRIRPWLISYRSISALGSVKLTVLCSRAVIGPDDDHMVGPINSLCGFASLYACFSYSSGTTMRLIPHAKRLYKYLSPAIFHRLRWAIGGSVSRTCSRPSGRGPIEALKPAVRLTKELPRA